MHGVHDLGLFRDILLVLATAALVVPLFERARLSPILGFVIAGAAMGPKGLGALTPQLPWLGYVTVGGGASLAILAELGVVFLLFLIGLELSAKRLVTMRRLVFGLGGLQIALCALVLAFAAAALGVKAEAATLIGASLALSSTAVVVELLSRQGRLPTGPGRTSFAVLLAQDLAVVPLLMLVTILGAQNGSSLAFDLVRAFGQGALALGAVTVLGTLLLRPLFRHVAASHNTELFVAATLLVAAGSGLVTAAAGLSMAIGAFVAGLLLSESEFRRAIEATLDPFKGLLLGVFFFTVGMSLDIGHLATQPLPILAATLGLVCLKGVIIAGLVRAFGQGWPAAAEIAFLLGGGGEFAFIIIGMAMTAGIVERGDGAFAQAVAALSIMLIPLLDVAGRRMSQHMRRTDSAPDPALALAPPEDSLPRAIVVGHGRVGALVSEMLDVHGIRHVVTERAPAVVSQARRAGRPVYFGDAKNDAFLSRCGIAHATAVIVTINRASDVDEVVATVRRLRSDLAIVARARDAEHARRLYDLGVTDAVPETIEASLQLSEASLVGLGVPMGPVIASIHEKRDEFRAELQRASAGSGAMSRSIRSKGNVKR
jgi:CPA2 family monovalent cation:H+ antiporter-2